MYFNHEPSHQPVHSGTWTGFFITLSCNLFGGIVYGITQYFDGIDKLTVLLLHLLGIVSVTIGIVVGAITLVDKIEARIDKRKNKKSDTPMKGTGL